MSCLEECGRLPVPTIQGYRQEIAKVNELMAFIEKNKLEGKLEQFVEVKELKNEVNELKNEVNELKN